MSSDEDKPPAPPVRLTSNRATDRGDSVASVDMRPLPKGIVFEPTWASCQWSFILSKNTIQFNTATLVYNTCLKTVIWLNFWPSLMNMPLANDCV